MVDERKNAEAISDHLGMRIIGAALVRADFSPESKQVGEQGYALTVTTGILTPTELGLLCSVLVTFLAVTMGDQSGCSVNPYIQLS